MIAREHKRRIVLLDAHAIIHRAYHALPDFSSSKGEPTGALYGLSSMLIKLINDLEPDYIAACYDVPSPTHRHQVYEGYKSTRKKADAELIEQLKRSKDIFIAFNIPIYEMAGFEADDILGTIVEKLKKTDDLEIIIASGDMDTLQLVSNKKVRVYTLRKGLSDTVTYDEDRVKERFGFGPELLPDYKGLRGDPSDNIIGVPGVGEKTATELIQKFKTIENIYETLSKKPEKLAEEGIKERIIEILKSHKDEAYFSKMLSTIRRDAPVEFNVPETNWRETTDISKIKNLFDELEFKSLFDRARDLLNGKVKEAEEKPTKKKSKKIVETEKGEQLKVPAEELERTALALWVVDSNISDPTLSDILNFAKTDSFEKAKEIIFEKLHKDGKTREVYEEIELPLLPIVKKMQERGVKIDLKYLKKLSKEYHVELDKLQSKIWKLAGEEFNINSPKQLSEILFKKLGLGGTKKVNSASGVRSTKESELEKIKDDHPIAALILEYRELQKLLSTYIDNIPERVNANNRLHASFVQTGTTTGRLSSQNPNLQNIPIKTELGKRIRNAFIAEEGFKLVGLDYSQIELRIAAFLSGDEKLIEIFKSGGDIHAGVASHVYKVPKEKVDHEMRRKAKVVNFGILYGMGINALRANLGGTREEAKHFYDEYFKNFSALALYLERTKAQASKFGFTETFFGRRRYFPDIHSKLPYIRAASERMAINAPLQGTCADIIKLAMIRVNDYLEKEKLTKKVYLILTVHDELVFEVEESIIEKVKNNIQNIMEHVILPPDLDGVPLVVKSSVGKNWGEME